MNKKYKMLKIAFGVVATLLVMAIFVLSIFCLRSIFPAGNDFKTKMIIIFILSLISIILTIAMMVCNKKLMQKNLFTIISLCGLTMTMLPFAICFLYSVGVIDVNGSFSTLMPVLVGLYIAPVISLTTAVTLLVATFHREKTTNRK